MPPASTRSVPLSADLLHDRPGGRPLPQALRARLERFFDADLSTVRIHQGPQAGALGAMAIAAGEHLHFAPGRYRPDTEDGLRLLGHEVTHVLQQRTGRVTHPFGGAVAAWVDDPALEAEADELGAACASPSAQAARGPCLWAPERAGAGRRVAQATLVNLTDSSKTTYNPFQKNDYEKFLYDYKLIQTWMSDQQHFLPGLGHLNAAIKSGGKLTDILLAKEKFYKLNVGGAPVYTGVLTGPEFVAMGQKGVLPKDHVTPEHGEHTHRIQWYIILYKATGGFTGPTSGVFYNSPFALLQGTTKKAYKPPVSGWPGTPIPRVKDGPLTPQESSNGSMWEALFDRRPLQTFNPLTETLTNDYLFSRDGITCPEILTAMLVPASKLPKGADGLVFFRACLDNPKWTFVGVDALRDVITARYVKRRGELAEFGGSQSKWAEAYALKKIAQASKSGKVYGRLGEGSLVLVQGKPVDVDVDRKDNKVDL